MSKELTTLQELKSVSKEDDLKQIRSIVSRNIPQLTSAALAAALGGTVVMKMSMNEQGKMKYVPCSTPEEISQGLEWIATYGNSLDNADGFYIVQQRPPDAKFWEYLTHRHLGKVPDSERESSSDKLDLAEIGRLAIASSHPSQSNPQNSLNQSNSTVDQKALADIPSSWQ